MVPTQLESEFKKSTKHKNFKSIQKCFFNFNLHISKIKKIHENNNLQSFEINQQFSHWSVDKISLPWSRGEFIETKV